MPASSRRLSVPVIAMFGVIIAIVALAAPASAEPYKKDHPTISVNKENPKEGSKIRVCISDLGKNVVFKLDGKTLAKVVVTREDKFCTTITLPAGVTGDETIVATGGGRTARVGIDIRGVKDRDGAGDKDRDGAGDKDSNGAGDKDSNGAGDKASGTSASGQNAGLQVLGVSASLPNSPTGVSASVPLQVAGVGASATPAAVSSGLAFTGASVIGIGALAVLLLLGGAVMVFSSRRRKVNG
jgi:hypothetical protein